MPYLSDSSQLSHFSRRGMHEPQGTAPPTIGRCTPPFYIFYILYTVKSPPPSPLLFYFFYTTKTVIFYIPE